MAFIDNLNRLFGDPNEKELKKFRPLVARVRQRQQSAEIQALTPEDLPKKTEELKARVAAGESLNDLLPEAFAVLIRACELLKGRKTMIGSQEFVWDMVPFDVQILGAAALHRGMIAEMKTGEGKTLVSTMAVYLNALVGKGVHVVTVNDYLARRDAQWMGMLYEALGLNVGVIVHGLEADERKAAYAADITYATNNELGFDYLRDNMASSLEHQVQRGLHYAIVDEVDSILIDEARTPLIISQPAAESTVKYVQYAALVKNLQENVHFNRDEKQRAAVLSDDGIRKMEQLLGVENIYTDKGFEEVHHIEQALRAHAIYKRDTDYVVKDGQVIIVDEFTGRLMPGRRYGHGLHQAIEAKEGVEVQRESKTLATITFQNYFRLYEKLAGMTGTAKTEEEEFESIYKLRVLVVPTNKPLRRIDRSDAIYRTVAAKFTAVARLAKERNATGQPLLIGTTSIEKSEALSRLLEKEGVPHEVLNAKNHAREADIVALAGRKGAVTIATNMAGRGTDIKLGDGVTELGGLCIIGTERHESRRIDNQLRGRAGRQGDPGESLFFVSMEDDLMRLFGGDRLKAMMERLNVPDDQPLQNAMVNRSIESAQKRIEGHHFDSRKHVLQYDNVMNKHREIIYAKRRAILEKLDQEKKGAANGQAQVSTPVSASEVENAKREAFSSIHDDILQSVKNEGRAIVLNHAAGVDADDWNVREMSEVLGNLHPALRRSFSEEELTRFDDAEQLADHVAAGLTAFYEDKCSRVDADQVAKAERVVTLRSIDTQWMDHIDEMQHLREQVAFSGYAQRDPLIEYQDRAFRKFRELLQKIESSIVRTLLQMDFAQFAPAKVLEQAERELRNLATNEDEIEEELRSAGASQASAASGSAHPQDALRKALQARAQAKAVQQQAERKVGRNDPCPCGSGKKYKKCHGVNA